MELKNIEWDTNTDSMSCLLGWHTGEAHLHKGHWHYVVKVGEVVIETGVCLTSHDLIESLVEAIYTDVKNKYLDTSI